MSGNLIDTNVIIKLLNGDQKTGTIHNRPPYATEPNNSDDSYNKHSLAVII